MVTDRNQSMLDCVATQDSSANDLCHSGIGI